jgi:hypothetical protein
MSAVHPVLGYDALEHHKLPRGRRPSEYEQSPALQKLNKTATELLSRASKGRRPSVASSERSKAMAYDVDVSQERYSYESGHRSRQSNRVGSPRDLETIITLLEVAALSLTTEEGATFSREELIREAKLTGGPEIDLRDEDIDIVLQKQGFLVKVGKELRLR